MQYNGPSNKVRVRSTAIPHGYDTNNPGNSFNEAFQHVKAGADKLILPSKVVKPLDK